MLLDLSAELFYKITTQLSTSDQKNLRSACTALNVAIQPLVLSFLVVRLDESHLYDLLTAISGTSGWSRWATTLSILAPGPTDDEIMRRIYGGAVEMPTGPPSTGRSLRAPICKTSFPGALAPTKELFADALSALNNVRTVIWKVRSDEYEWTRRVAFAFILTHPFLRDLQIDMGRFEIPLGDVGGLTKLKVATSLFKSPSETVVSGVAANIALNRSTLTGLHLVGHGAAWAEIWTFLASEKQPQLAEITTNTVTADLLAYLGSYSGVERLNLLCRTVQSVSESDTLADTFFGKVLPLHIDSLIELSCLSNYEGRWSFGAHSADLISRMHNIESLALNVNAANLYGVEPQHNTVVGKSNLTASNDRSFVCAQIALLQLGTRLQSLCNLAIVAANAAYNRWNRCGNESMNHLAVTNQAIVTTALAFRTDIPSTAVLYAAKKWYSLSPSGDSDIGAAEEEIRAQGNARAGLLAYTELAPPDVSSQRLHHLADPIF
ncbi:hypothetical protein K438DRAFT_1773424 [Mycena galopus ATCC 62051]|nr:hypothetical protein K438DRAFT_1773424 [Mycena galopus ATCC 62051]